jgi:hypothetical protein
VRDNISKNERIALKNFTSDDSITIKEADKGGATVIMDKEHYKEMALEQFSDNITEKERDYLLNFEVKPVTFMDFQKSTNLNKFKSEYRTSVNHILNYPVQQT